MLVAEAELEQNKAPNHDPKFPDVIDSTIVAAFRACKQKAYKEFFRRISPGESEHLVFGAAFAAGLHTFRQAFYGQGLSFEEALYLAVLDATAEYGMLEVNDRSVKTYENLLLAFNQYFKDFPPASDDLKPYMTPQGPMTEFTFAFDIPGVKNPSTGDPLLYGGRSDMIGQLMGESLWVCDEKTTKQMGDSWARQWVLRSQFPGYAYGAKVVNGLNVSGVIVRGICLYKRNQPKTMQSIVYIEDWKLERWMMELKATAADMVRCWNEGYWNYDLNDACSAYGGCHFLDLCNSRREDNWLDQYPEREWDPLHRGL